MTDESARTGTVLIALVANIGVGLSKLVAGMATGSGALLAEAAHSVGDSATEVLLLVAVKRSRKPADRAHPFGYGKERYFWSLMASQNVPFRLSTRRTAEIHRADQSMYFCCSTESSYTS
jgi:divalent metal cation (Fe/Co/Zn/Cd) transporter